jgi:hypothetical protein
LDEGVGVRRRELLGACADHEGVSRVIVT